jgi:DNA-binding transcriptional MerR regulator
MKISDVSKRSGLSISTIRFYENSGLCPSVERGADRKRLFLKADTPLCSCEKGEISRNGQIPCRSIRQ